MISTDAQGGGSGGGEAGSKARAGGSAEGEKSQEQQQDGPEGEAGVEDEEEKLGVKGALQLMGFAMILGLVGVCGYFIVAELLPSKMAPNTVMSDAHEAFMADPDVSTEYSSNSKSSNRSTRAVSAQIAWAQIAFQSRKKSSL